MKTILSVALLLGSLALGIAATTVNSTNKYSYGANVGWMDWRGDTNSGVVVGEYVCSGYIYAANVGWINLGNGAPTNGIRYQNLSANDFGVNHDGLGNLSGLAYGANIGWINFESNGAAKMDLSSGKLSGSVYSANCGWISLSNAFAFVQTDSIRAGTDSDGDGIADAWELTYFNSLTNATAVSDHDGDGQSDLSEYIADTNPLNASDNLRILSNSVAFTSGFDTDILNWTSRPSRKYRIQHRSDLNPGFLWNDAGILFNPSPGTNTIQAIGFGSSSSQRYFRVQAVMPLP